MSIENVNFELETSSVGLGFRKVRQVITYDDFTDAGTTGTLTMDDAIPAGSFVIGSKVKVITGFTGDSTTCVLIIGDSGNEDAYSGNSTHNIYTAADNLVLAAFINGDCGLNAEGSDNDILLVATGGGTDFSDVSAGEIVVEVFYFSTNLELP